MSSLFIIFGSTPWYLQVKYLEYLFLKAEITSFLKEQGEHLQNEYVV